MPCSNWGHFGYVQYTKCMPCCCFYGSQASRRKFLAEINVKHQHGHAPMRCSTSSTVIRERPSHSLLTTMLPLLHSIAFSSPVSLQFITKSCMGTIGAHGVALGSFAESSSTLMRHCCADRSPAYGVPCHGYSMCRRKSCGVQSRRQGMWTITQPNKCMSLAHVHDLPPHELELLIVFCL